MEQNEALVLAFILNFTVPAGRTETLQGSNDPFIALFEPDIDYHKDVLWQFFKEVT